MKFCPSCRKEYSDSTEWCRTCSVPLVPRPETQECPHCGRRMPASAGMCPFCGEHVDGAVDENSDRENGAEEESSLFEEELTEEEEEGAQSEEDTEEEVVTEESSSSHWGSVLGILIAVVLSLVRCNAREKRRHDAEVRFRQHQEFLRESEERLKRIRQLGKPQFSVPGPSRKNAAEVSVP